MSERKASALDRRSATGRRAPSLVWPIVLGFAMSLILAVVLYYAFKEELILKRSIAITPPAPAAPIGRLLIPEKLPTK